MIKIDALIEQDSQGRLVGSAVCPICGINNAVYVELDFEPPISRCVHFCYISYDAINKKAIFGFCE